MNNSGEGWMRVQRGWGVLIRLKRRKSKIGFTLSPRNISADNQRDMVKDKFHAHSVKIRVHRPYSRCLRIHPSPQRTNYHKITVKLHPGIAEKGRRAESST